MAFQDLPIELPDIDPGMPAGPSLEFDPAFGELERAAQGKPEQQYGDTVIPGEDPIWKDVASQAADLLDRTRDLRVLAFLAVARLQMAGAQPSGLADFVKVLGMIRHQVADRWDSVHPQLDPEDDNDPTLRGNALLALAEPVRVVRLLRTLPLAISQRGGPVSWRTIGVFNGSIETADQQERVEEASIRAAFKETGAAKLSDLRDTIELGVKQLNGIGSAFDSNAGYGYGPDFSALVKLLQEMSRYIVLYAPPPDAIAEEAMADEMPDDLATGVVSTGAVVQPRATAFSISSLKSVDNRVDALHLLDLVCRYYEEKEPSSPLPLLVGRARRLADKSFLEVLQELAPDGLMQAQVVVKSRDE
jgi:type VI secretion system protein ImpA